LELPGTRAEFWIAGAYHQVRARRQSPRCTLWDSHVSACVDTRPEVLATLERVSTVMAR
jgi:hypothetical protein